MSFFIPFFAPKRWKGFMCREQFNWRTGFRVRLGQSRPTKRQIWLIADDWAKQPIGFGRCVVGNAWRRGLSRCLTDETLVGGFVYVKSVWDVALFCFFVVFCDWHTLRVVGWQTWQQHKVKEHVLRSKEQGQQVEYVDVTGYAGSRYRRE